jgi:hypothetical protein
MNDIQQNDIEQNDIEQNDAYQNDAYQNDSRQKWPLAASLMNVTFCTIVNFV